jgi:hypothetical protein
MGGEAAARELEMSGKILLLAAASPPTTPKALVIPRRLISENANYPKVADNQRGKREIMYDSGEGSHPWEEYAL